VSLVQRMTALNDRLQGLPIRFGVPQFRPVVIRKKVLEPGALIPTVSYLPLSPTPQVSTVSPHYVGYKLDENLTLSKDDLVVKGVSRRYSYELLTEAVDVWLVDAIPNGSGYTGVECLPIWIQDSELLSWTVTLRRQVDRFLEG
jgi:hypothetical protein